MSEPIKSYNMLVASLAEAWIEIIGQDAPAHDLPVASLAEAWIEIFPMKRTFHSFLSPPSRRRGLKFL